jgi:type II secretory pathway pseudopilin PulG
VPAYTHTLPKCLHAFTMMETMVAFIMLGLIASLTLPTLLGVSTDERLIASYKRDTMIVQEIGQAYYASDHTQTFLAFVMQRTAGDKKCTTNGNTEGCANAAGTFYNNPTLILRDNSALIFMNDGTVYIDADGPNHGLNTDTSDLFPMLVNTTKGDIRRRDSSSSFNGSVLRPGGVSLLYDLNSSSIPAGTKALYTLVLGNEAVSGTASGMMDNIIQITPGSSTVAPNVDSLAPRNGAFTPIS